tara:strand:+ start:2053 stop:2244 length:192 start_codon:yes stop_codon:yes gene_type:complete
MMQSIEFTDLELEILQTLMGHTRDDPRKHGLIGTCFWRMDFTPDDQQKIQETFSSLEQKLNQN